MTAHPNEPGAWTRIETVGGLTLWRRDRNDPYPLSMYYLVAPPRQTELFYDEAKAQERLSLLRSPVATEV